MRYVGVRSLLSQSVTVDIDVGLYLQVMLANVRSFRSAAQDLTDPILEANMARWVDVIQQHCPDLVVFNEAVRPVDDVAIDHLATLAHEVDLQLHWKPVLSVSSDRQHRQSYDSQLPNTNNDFDFGNALLLSHRLKVLSQRSFQLPTTGKYQPQYSTYKHEPRKAELFRLATGELQFDLLITHLSRIVEGDDKVLVQTENHLQLDALVRIAQQSGNEYPVLIMGDLNSDRQSHQVLTENSFTLCDSDMTRNGWRVDRIAASQGLRFDGRARTLAVPSDHRALTVRCHLSRVET